MRFTLTIQCDNDAFGETATDRSAEVERILRSLAHTGVVIVEHAEGLLRDANGNGVGRYYVTAD